MPDDIEAVIPSIPRDSVPAKLRCANCSTINHNAWRLSCCETSICETCYGNLPTQCPICEHTPFSKDLCKPHASLRKTVIVWIKTIQKRREKEKRSATQDSTPAAPTSAASQEAGSATPGQQISSDAAQAISTSNEGQPSNDAEPIPSSEQTEREPQAADGRTSAEPAQEDDPDQQVVQTQDVVPKPDPSPSQDAPDLTPGSAVGSNPNAPNTAGFNFNQAMNNFAGNGSGNFFAPAWQAAMMQAQMLGSPMALMGSMNASMMGAGNYAYGQNMNMNPNMGMGYGFWNGNSGAAVNGNGRYGNVDNTRGSGRYQHQSYANGYQHNRPQPGSSRDRFGTHSAGQAQDGPATNGKDTDTGDQARIYQAENEAADGYGRPSNDEGIRPSSQASVVPAETAAMRGGGDSEAAAAATEDNQQYFQRAVSPPGPDVPQGPSAQFASMGQQGWARGPQGPRGRGRGAAFAPVAPAPGVPGAPTGPRALREGFRGRSGGRPGSAGGHPGTAGGQADSFGRSRQQSADFSAPMSPVARADPASHEEPDEMGHAFAQERGPARLEGDGVSRDRGRDTSPSSEDVRRSSGNREELRAGRRDRERSLDRKRRRRRSRSRTSDAGRDYDHGADGRSSRRKRRRGSSRRRHRQYDDDTNRRHSRREGARSPVQTDHNRVREGQPNTTFEPREFKIQGRSKMTELDRQREMVREQRPNMDPHALEREARNRERMVKENQRRNEVSTNALNGGRLAAGVHNDFGHGNGERTPEHGRSGRRRRNRRDHGSEGGRSRRGQAYSEHEMMDKMAESEHAREAGRWD